MEISTGIVTLPGFLYFWGLVFVVTTTIVAVIKKETEFRGLEHETVPERDLQTAYGNLLGILKLKPIQTLVIILLTCKIGFSATDSVMGLKLVEAGVPKEQLGLLAVPLIPLQIALPLVISKYTTGESKLIFEYSMHLLLCLKVSTFVLNKYIFGDVL